MNFKDFINSFKAGDSSWERFPALFDRIIVAKNIINNDKYLQKRTIKSPEYLTDFGLRHSYSQKLFIEYHCKRLKKCLPTDDEIKKELLSLNINKLTGWIDAVVLILGNYEVCYNVLKLRINEVNDSLDTISLIKLGTLCGIQNDPEMAELLFKLALKRTQNANTRRTILHRIDVLLLKRKKKVPSFYKETADIISNIIAYDNSEEIISLLDNLVAFQLILSEKNTYGNNFQLARLLLTNAKNVLKFTISNCKTIDNYLTELVRYNSQIAINQVQLELAIGNMHLAERIMIENIKIVKKYNGEYISEALSSLAYIYHKEKNYPFAINTAIDAIIEHSKIGNVVGINMSKKLLATSLYRYGKEEMASRVLETLTSDPLGIKDIYDRYRIRS